MVIRRKNKRGWIKIVEAFVSILLIVGVLLIVINKGYIGRTDISSRVYETELAILREVQSDDNFRSDILSTTGLPAVWGDLNFPQTVQDKIESRIPNYLDCEAMICSIDLTCNLEKEDFEKDIYTKSVTITAEIGTYNPRQLKLFCWVK